MTVAANRFRIDVRLPENLAAPDGSRSMTIETPVETLGQLVGILEQKLPGFDRSEEEIYNFAVNGELVLHGESSRPLESGDQVELMIVFAGG